MTRTSGAGTAGMAAAGAVLKEHVAEIINRWLHRTMVDVRVPDHHRAELRNHLPQLLYRMGEDLAKGQTRHSASTERAAEAHGHQRWEIGWSLEEVVRDFQTLRPIIEQVVRERGGVELPVEVRRNLDILIDEAIVESIRSFTQFHQQMVAGSHQAEAVLAAIVNCSADAIISMSLDGEILSWNPAAEQLYGYRAGEVIGQSAKRLLRDEDAAQLDMFLATVARGESIRSIDTIRVAKEGKPLEVAVSVSPVRSSLGEVVGCAMIEQEISQRVQAAHALRQAVAEAEQANRSKTDFLANVSHELRSPMNAIMGMTALSLEEELTPVLRDNLLTIRDGANQMLHLVDDLLDVARLESGLMEVEDEPLELRAVLESTMRVAGLRASQKGLELVCHISSEVPDRLRGDATRLQQILSNLIDNAVKFTDQGEIVVCIERAGGDDAICSLRCSVSDTGIGISAEHRARVFAPFAQVDPSPTRRFSGTGLGLTIACHLVRSLGGTLELESEVGKGSRFWFTAQFGVMPKHPAGAGQHKSRSLLKDLPVLVVDDNRASRRAIAQLLEGWGMRVKGVDGSSAALEALKEEYVEGPEGKREARSENEKAAPEPYRLVLVDALMPGIDGLELVDRMAAMPERPPAILLMVAPGDRLALRDRLDSAPIAGILDKPIGESKLHAAIVGTLVAGKDDVTVKCESPMTNASEPVAPLDVLLVEDTMANRKVVERVLGKRGHRVTTAFNGREALELVRQQRFDVILMDVQMPIMDGFQAASAIRQWETENNIRHPTPIIAMTAHAMRSDRDRCFAAGMSGYIAKPMDIHLLAQTVENSAQQAAADSRALEADNGKPAGGAPSADRSPHAAADQGASGAAHRESIDLDQAYKRLRGDRVLLDELILCYRDDHQALLDQISEALDQEAAKVAHRAAHNLKGLASNFDAVRTPHFAQQVEHACAAGDLGEARRLMPELIDAARELATLLPPVDRR